MSEPTPRVLLTGLGIPESPRWHGRLRQVADEIQFPNGMVITPDNRTLIASESFAGRLTAFDIGADGGLSNRRVFADGLGPDGICLTGGSCSSLPPSGEDATRSPITSRG